VSYLRAKSETESVTTDTAFALIVKIKFGRDHVLIDHTVGAPRQDIIVE
jgi:hypothetical protein